MPSHHKSHPVFAKAYSNNLSSHKHDTTTADESDGDFAFLFNADLQVDKLFNVSSVTALITGGGTGTWLDDGRRCWSSSETGAKDNASAWKPHCPRCKSGTSTFDFLVSARRPCHAI